MIRLGFIGAGGIACYHAATIRRQVGGYALRAAADLSAASRATFAAENPDTELFDDYRKMLRLDDLDAVAVALPTALHKRATIAAARAGKHVFCEKPMAMSWADAQAMIEACETAGVKLMIGQVRRYDACWGTCKKLVEAGVIGRPVLWRCVAGGAGPDRGWFMDAKLGGGPFLDGAVHNWDFANYMFGTPVTALGSIMTFRETTAVDTGAVVVRYAGGDEVMLSWSWGLPRGSRAGTVTEVLGPNGIIHFPGSFDATGLPAYDRENCDAFMIDTGEAKRLEIFPRRDMFAAEWCDFRDAIVEDRSPQVTGQHGQLAMSVGLAVVRAGRLRRPVKIRAN